MATTPERELPQQYDHGLPDWAITALKPLASLKLTVALFVLAIFIVLAGTLAQVDADVWEVVDKYFRVAIAWIPVRIFFPPAIFPNGPRPSPEYVFPFPGGWLIGALMAFNLLAAHLIRFKVQARGSRLVSGLVVLLLGFCLTYAVIAASSQNDSVMTDPAWAYRLIWTSLLSTATAMAIGSAISWWRTPAERRLTRWIWGLVAVVVGGTLVWMFATGLWRQPSDSSMRILWQLSKSGLAAVTLFAGCWLIFNKRAGVVLLHGGIGLMMFGELLVGVAAVEGQMSIKEGEVVNFVQDIRTLELAVTTPVDAKQDGVTVIPKALLLQSFNQRSTIDDEHLPFKIRVLKFIQNSRLVGPAQAKENLADQGIGKQVVAEEIPAGTGVSSDAKVDLSAAYVQLESKGSDSKSLGTYLVGLMLPRDDTVTVDGKPYEISLRFKRTYKPYSVKLLDVRKDDYLGTDTPRNYSSDIHLVDPTRQVDREIHVWMNNPLRFAGETFYQTGYFKDPSTGVEQTTLQVVSNTGWMIPYVSCVIVALGLLVHFSLTLATFLSKSERLAGLENSSADKKGLAAPTVEARWLQWGMPGFAVIVGLAVMAVGLTPRPAMKGKMNLDRFAELPVLSQGRAKPIDTLARHSLLAVSSQETFKDANEKRQPAILWLLDLIGNQERAFDHRVMRIENFDVQGVLKLEPREHFRYAINEFLGQLDAVQKETSRLHDLPAEDLQDGERKLLEFERKMGVIDLLLKSFAPPRISQDGRDMVTQIIQGMQMQDDLLKRHPPLAIPPVDGPVADSEIARRLQSVTWETFANSWLKDLIKPMFKDVQANPATDLFSQIVTAYREGNEEAFNKQVENYHAYLQEHGPSDLNMKKVHFEAFFNRFNPFFLSRWLYVPAFVFAALSWLWLPVSMRRSAIALTVLVLVLHSFAIVGRIYISGRPPVTNLYSSAVFIGWGVVVLGLILERVFRNGLGVAASTIAGFATLGVAQGLASDGSDTFSVMQAVLDTQFWLSTHVVCITLGYSTTYLAGLFGLMYVILGLVTTKLDQKLSRDLARMMHGTLCFSIFFSFVGTVLGGLWADDSWGRFWGWDPKENGALIIVLWNALCLHARWDGMVKTRGLALLCIAGNIAVSWSWFGVNELGVGLHAYGFRDGMMQALKWFAASQIAVMAAGLIPMRYWLSGQANRDLTPAS